jgi:iron complex outermembrane receptor protein
MFKRLAVGAALLAAACSGNPAPASVSDSDQVNIGYGTQDRREVGGAVNTIKREDIDKRSPRSIEDVIRSHVPGAQIVHSREGFAIRLRGATSIYGSNDALIVLDGMPLAQGSAASALAAIRPEEVSRIDVLKDGMAAIYGVRGANGVVVIQTRR